MIETVQADLRANHGSFPVCLKSPSYVSSYLLRLNGWRVHGDDDGEEEGESMTPFTSLSIPIYGPILRQ